MGRAKSHTMTKAERIEFLKARTEGIGGSSAASLLQPYLDVEYGCQRRLWYRLSGTEPDYAELENEPMAVGSVLEKPICDAYAEFSGRRVVEVPLKKHVDVPILQVHIDREIYPTVGDVRDTPGTLEAKAVGDQVMRKIQSDGLIIDYLLQAQHGMLCHDHSWGAFVVGKRSQFAPYYLVQVMAAAEGRDMPPIRKPRPIFFDVERNKDICDSILAVGPEFWSTLKDTAKIPKRLEPDDDRCQGCSWRKSCQGAALVESVDPEDHPKSPPLMPELLPLVIELQQRHDKLVECQELEEETKKKIKATLDRVPAASVMIGEKRKNILYRLRSGARRIRPDVIVPAYSHIRNLAIKAGLPGAELTPTPESCYEIGVPSRPLLTSSVLTKKEKKSPEWDDGVEGGED